MQTKIILMLIFGGILMSCAPSAQLVDRAPISWTRSSASDSEKAQARVAVIAELKDPDSASFGEIYALDGSNGVRSICGYVNAKNSFGGYTGMIMFRVNSEGSVIVQGTDTLGSLLPGICQERVVK